MCRCLPKVRPANIKNPSSICRDFAYAGDLARAMSLLITGTTPEYLLDLGKAIEAAPGLKTQRNKMEAPPRGAFAKAPRGIFTEKSSIKTNKS